MSALTRIFALAALALPLMHCAVESTEDEAVSDQSEDELRGKGTERWVYNGPLPHLVSPSVVVSQTAHTARVTGTLPADFTGELPFYAERFGGNKVVIVYPIATGSSFNAQPNSYGVNRVSPWVTNNDKAPWGGFPFIPYSGGVAFHGPITKDASGEWRLIRGPVSHGCNRMQGEHVVELAHLFGVDMTTEIRTGVGISIPQVPVSVIRKDDVFEGKPVDVDYPAQNSVRRPAGARMFKTWDSKDYPAIVCAFTKTDAVDNKVPANYCAGVRGLRNARSL